MNKLLKTTLLRVIGSFLLIPVILFLITTYGFHPWIIETLLFGSMNAAFSLAFFLSFVPMLITLWYLVVGIRSLKHEVNI